MGNIEIKLLGAYDAVHKPNYIDHLDGCSVVWQRLTKNIGKAVPWYPNKEIKLWEQIAWYNLNIFE